MKRKTLAGRPGVLLSGVVAAREKKCSGLEYFCAREQVPMACPGWGKGEH